MEKINKINLKKVVTDHIIKKIFVINILSCIYLVFFNSRMIFVSIIILLFLLFFFTHWLIIKNFDTHFYDTDNINYSTKKNKFNFFRDMFFLQIKVFLLNSWLYNHVLLHSKCTLVTSQDSNLLINGFINWLLFISVLLGLGYYRYQYRSINIRLAKCIIPTAEEQPSITLYNQLLGIETYIRIMGFIILITIPIVQLFENISKNNSNSFLANPTITSFIIVMIFAYCKNSLEKLIDYLFKKYSINFIGIFGISFGLMLVAIFIINNLLLSQISFLHSISSSSSASKQCILAKLTPYFLINKNRLKILSIGINVIMVFGAASDIFLKRLNGIKIRTIYFYSFIFPLVYTFLCYKSHFIITINNFMITELANFLIIICILVEFKLNYKDINHILCMFGIKNTETSGKTQKIKFDYGFVIKSSVALALFFLSAYYLFSLFLIEQIVALASISILPVIIILIITILYKNKKLVLNKIGFIENKP